MGENSKIEWCDATFNPWVGCTKVSPGCEHCYAERFGHRFGVQWGVNLSRRRTSESYWKQPLAWNRRAECEGKMIRVFCASLADVFDSEVPQQWRVDLFRLILQTPHLDWLLLTKRIGNARHMIQEAMWCCGFHNGMHHSMPANVWLGASSRNARMQEFRCSSNRS